MNTVELLRGLLALRLGTPRTHEEMTEDKVKECLRMGVKSLLENDWRLVKQDVNERSITAKLATYLTPLFAAHGYEVDCEYNRVEMCKKGSKQLDYLVDNTDYSFSETKDSDDYPAKDSDGKTVYPDIIVHHRGRTEPADNLLVVEAKKHRTDNNDRLKLKAFTTDEREGEDKRPVYGYQLGLALVFLSSDTKVTATGHWFKKGEADNGGAVVIAEFDC
jgi:hypothetical protein